MSARIPEMSPQTLARIGGVLYFIIIAIGLVGEAYVRGSIVVPGDVAGTAAHLKSMESLWRLGVAAEFLLLSCAVPLALILYVLLRPVSRNLALLATFFDLISVAIEAGVALNLVQALFPLGGAAYLGAFTPEQLAALANFSIKTHSYGFGVALIFFGWFCLLAGYLIFRSGYFPKAIGVLMQIAGACYLVNSFALILAPSLANQLFPAILVPSFIGESSLCLWLIFKGVDVAKFNAGALTSR